MSLIDELQKLREIVKKEIVRETSLKSTDEIFAYATTPHFKEFFYGFESEALSQHSVSSYKDSLAKLDKQEVVLENSELTKALKALFSEKYYKFTEKNSISF